MKNRNDKSGFTLIEVMVASFILLIGILGVHNLLMWIMMATSASRQITEASCMAQDKMEGLMSQGYASATSGAESRENFDMTWLAGGATAGQKELTVTVTWTDIKNKPRQVIVKSMVVDTSLAAAGLPGVGVPGT